MGVKGFMDRVKGNQAKTAEENSTPVVTIQVLLFNDKRVEVHRPEGNNPAQLAAIINLLAAAQQIICQVLAKSEPSRIVLPPPGARVN